MIQREEEEGGIIPGLSNSSKVLSRHINASSTKASHCSVDCNRTRHRVLS